MLVIVTILSLGLKIHNVSGGQFILLLSTTMPKQFKIFP